MIDVELIASRLRALRDKNLANIDSLIAEEKDFDHDFCSRYYRENLRFSFGKREREGLKVFEKLCERHELIPKRDLKFELV